MTPPPNTLSIISGHKKRLLFNWPFLYLTKHTGHRFDEKTCIYTMAMTMLSIWEKILNGNNLELSQYKNKFDKSGATNIVLILLPLVCCQRYWLMETKTLKFCHYFHLGRGLIKKWTTVQWDHSYCNQHIFDHINYIFSFWVCMDGPEVKAHKISTWPEFHA